MTGTTSPITTEWLSLPADIRARAEEIAGNNRPVTWPEVLLLVGTAIAGERERAALAEEAEWAAKECLWSIYDDYIALGGTKKPTYGPGLWQPIETAPKDGTAIWVGHTAGMMEPALYHREGSGFWVSAFTGLPVQWRPTHWQPLPAAPETEREAME